jgi:hypothetical protein
MRRRPILVAWLLACTAGGVAAQTVRGSGVAKTETRNLAPFDRIEVAGSFEVTLVDGLAHKVTVEADDNLLDAVSTDVIDNELKISSLRSFVSRSPMKVTVESPQQRGLTVSGNAHVTAAALRGPSFTLSGSGSATAKLGGTAESLKVSLAGSGKIDALNLVADKVDVELLGSGTAEVHAVKSLSLMVIGSGTVRYRGNPTISRTAIGVGRVEKLD